MSAPLTSSFGIILSELFGVIPKTFFWWYSDGLTRILAWSQQRLSFRWRSLAVRSWSKHLFQPMYGQYDFTGRAISVVMRFLVLLWRLFVLFFTILLYFIVILLWFFVPAFVVALLVLNSMAALGFIRI
ncbi:MAG: hypothetical protein KC582_04510 [Candidatus Magasanikbacteria bacterium]|nr:hypothetical protein [Candidatus Magasanikbacteria bacterium]USN52810.1 MAG: hypothetical protein H6759_01950 [Candidatus Nomurabacteria bacterium]